MPSDPRVRTALDLLAVPIGRFQAAVVAALEGIRAELTRTRTGDGGRAEQLTAQLGPFAQGRLDGERLAAVLGGDRTCTPGAQKRLEAACDTLQDIAARGTGLLCVTVPSGTTASAAVDAQLDVIGCAFGAARVATAAMGGRTTVGTSDEQALARFPFAEWIAAERRLAPPLVVMVSGRDLDASSLARFLDGALKIVLIVDGPVAPAPLVRLITPNTFVTQTHELDAVAQLGEWPGAGVVAVMPPTGAGFTHVPMPGTQLWQRLTLAKSVDVRLGRIADLSATQQQEEILQLEALAAKPVALPANPVSLAATPAPDNGVDRLAAWLLQQADLAQPEGRQR